MEVLCWGGPEHGEVHRVPDVKLSSGRVTFPLKPRQTFRLFADNKMLTMPSVEYIVKQLYAPFQTYTVLIYAEDAHRLLIHLLKTMNALCWLVRYNRPIISGWVEFPTNQRR